MCCASAGLERRKWRRLIRGVSGPGYAPAGYAPASASACSTPQHHIASTDTELTTLDTHELWLPESSVPEPTPSTMSALHQFGVEMLKLSRGLGAPAGGGAGSGEDDDDGDGPQEHDELLRDSKMARIPLPLPGIGLLTCAMDDCGGGGGAR